MARGARWLISLFRSRRVRRELELTASRVNRRVELPSDKVLVTEKVILLRAASLAPSTKPALIRTHAERDCHPGFLFRRLGERFLPQDDYHTRKMAHCEEVVSQEFIRRNIISSPEIGTRTH